MDRRAEALLEDCTLCPRMCYVNRLAGETGYCGCGDKLRVARASLHMWEEPCISGKEGSGTIFFGGCSLGCSFCQNRQITGPDSGIVITGERLAQIMIELQGRGANNINLVTPTHFLPQIAAAIPAAREEGLKVPIVWNSSGYENAKALEYLDGLVDIFLPDFKYGPASDAQKWSDVTDYFERASEAIGKMTDLAGDPEFDSRGMMKRGVIVRVLLLPGHVKESMRIVDHLLGTWGDHIYISLMNQYTPMPGMEDDPLLGRKVTKREYRKLVEHALDKGLKNGFIQEGETATESFIPLFNGEGVLTR